MSSPSEVIHCSGLYAGYGSETVLEDVCLSVKAGDFLGIMGPNGGGKTTLIRVLLGLVPFRRGSVSVMGLPPVRGRTRVGYVPQAGGHDPAFPITAVQVASMGRLGKGRLAGRLSRRDRSVIADSMERAGVADLGRKPMGELSCGQRQRVLFARALAVEPEIMLLDEPTASMDPEASAMILELLHRLNDTVTVVITSHDLTTVFTSVKSVVCLNRTLHRHPAGRLTPETVRETCRCAVDLLSPAEKGT